VHGGDVEVDRDEMLRTVRPPHRGRENLDVAELRVGLHRGVQVVLKRLGRRIRVRAGAVGQAVVRAVACEVRLVQAFDRLVRRVRLEQGDEVGGRARRLAEDQVGAHAVGRVKVVDEAERLGVVRVVADVADTQGAELGVDAAVGVGVAAGEDPVAVMRVDAERLDERVGRFGLHRCGRRHRRPRDQEDRQRRNE
jgi:hypothetical protein